MASTSFFTASASSTPSIPQRIQDVEASSTPSIPQRIQDVFLSFRGVDTRCNFTDHLYKALVDRGIRTFRDDKLRRGEGIAPELSKAIEESRSSVIVFSENYARSRWCLDELVKIMECQKDLGHAVFPIFYHVDPSHVRKQEGSFGAAFAGYEANWKDKVGSWRTALTEAANLAGWHLQDGYETDYIKEITNNIFHRLNCKRFDVGANLVGIDSRVKEMCWEIVRENFPKEPNKWSRLWDSHDIERALTTSEGIKGVETIDLDLSKLKRLHFNSNVFSKMTSLRLLRVHSYVNIFLGCYDEMKEEEEVDPYYEKIIDSAKKTASKVQLDLDFEIPSNELRYLCWDGYPLDSLPSNFDGENLVELHLKCSNIKQLWQGNKYLESLKVIDLSYSTKLVQMPEFSSLSNLERLILKGCVSLIDIHPSLGVLKKLTTLNLRLCHKLKGLPSSISNLESLELLDLSKCSRFGKFSEIQGNMRCPWEPYLKEIAIKEHPTSIENSRSFWDLDPCGHSNLEKFPGIQGNMRSLRLLYLSKTAIKELLGSIDLESVESLDLSYCSKFEKFPENGANMKSLRELDLTHTAIKELPIGISNWESLRTLDLSKCSKFEKFPAIQGNMRNLKELLLNNTAIKCLPDSIGYLKSLEILNVSDCSKFENFPEKGGNMKNLKRLLLKNTPINDLPDGIGELESLEILDLSDCSKFEKFPEKGGNMKSLAVLRLMNTAIKDLPDSIGSLESLVELDLSNCSKFEKFPEKGGNMKRLGVLYLTNTAIKDLPDSIGSLDLVDLDLSNCSQFEKFPELKRSMLELRTLNLRRTAIKELPSSIDNVSELWDLDISECKNLRSLPDNISRLEFLESLILGGCSNLWEGLISNQLHNLGKLNTSQWKMAEKTLELPSSLERIDAHHCTSKEDLSSLLWLCHLNWLKSATEELKCWKLSAVIPESSGIPEWIRYENLGSELTTELPTNWYEDPDLLGFVVSCLYQPIPTSHDPRISYHFSSAFSCELNLHGNGFGFKDERRFGCRCECQGNFNDMIDQVWVWWYPKIAIPKEHLHNSTHINASFKRNTYCDASVNIKKCGINLIFVGDQQNYMPMLEYPQNFGDNGSALQDTNGNVHGANQDDEHYHIPMFLDLDGNFGGNGSVVLEDTVGNRKRRRDDSLPVVVEEPHYKRLGAPNTDLSH